MNIKLISKALHTLSLLSDEDVAIVFGLRSASEDERSVLTLALEPNNKPQKKSSERTIEHCAACNYTRRAQVHKDAFVTGYHEFQSSAKSSKKSAGGGGGRSSRGQSIKNQLSNRRQGQQGVSIDDNEDDERCTYKIGEDAGGPIICDTTIDNNVHHKRTDPDYHPFVSTAQPAEPSSNQVTSGTGKGVVSSAAQGGG